MALKESGVRLVAQGYQEYMRKLAAVNKANAEAFNAQPAKEMKRGTEQASQGASRFSKALGTAAKAAGVLAVALGAVKLAQFAKASAMVAANNEMLGVVLDQVAKTAGYTKEQTAFAEQSVEALGITTSAARQSLVQMAQANIEWADASKLARLAQDAAKIANINSSEAFERLVTATQRGNTLMLRTMNLQVNFQKAYKDMRKELGDVGMELTEQQKVQARVNAVVQAGTAIAGTYEAAQGAVAGQMQSMRRHMEQAQDAIGQTLLPLLRLRVELETNFWKALKKTAPALTGWGEILAGVGKGLISITEELGKFIKKTAGLEESSDLWTELAKQVHNFARFFVVVAAEVAGFFGAMAVGVAALKEGPEAFAKWATSFGEIREQLRDAAMIQALEKFPSIAKSYEQLSEEAEVAAVSMDRGTDAITEQTAALKEQQTALQQRLEILKKVEDIALRFERALADEAERFAKEKAKFNVNAAKKEAELTKKLNKALSKLDLDAAKREAEIIQEANKRRVEQEKERNLALEQERRRFMLSQAQSLRRFQLSESRLRAEGDILGLIRLREDFTLQQQEEQENRQLSLREEQENYAARQRQEAEDLQARLRELQEGIAQQRQEILTAFRDEFLEMQRANLEKRQEMERAHMERLEDARRARDRSLEDLGRALSAEQKLTQEGMEAVADEIAKVFGDQGAADALMQGWAARSESVIANTIGTVLTQLQALEEAITSLEETGMMPQRTPQRTPRSSGGTRRSEGSRGFYGMREGGTGVVTGPATFEVEPGVTEAFSFAPLSAVSTLNVEMSGGFAITGAERADAATVNTSLERMVSALEEVVRRRISRRGR